jgi:hypothetical protein
MICYTYNRKDKRMKTKKISTMQIGDNKLPNKYWVSICEDYYIQEDNCLNWISEKNLFEPKSEILGVFDSYKKAKDLAESIELSFDILGVRANVVTIVDRITGQLYERIKVFDPLRARIYEERFEDLKFTEKRLGKAII